MPKIKHFGIRHHWNTISIIVLLTVDKIVICCVVVCRVLDGAEVCPGNDLAGIETGFEIGSDEVVIARIVAGGAGGAAVEGIVDGPVRNKD